MNPIRAGNENEGLRVQNTKSVCTKSRAGSRIRRLSGEISLSCRHSIVGLVYAVS